MKNNFLLSALLFFIVGLPAYSATFTSNGTGGGNYNLASSWNLTAGLDADGIPDADDDATVLGSDNIVFNTTGFIQHLTVEGTLTGQTGGVLYIYGNYTMNGLETGSAGQILFVTTIGTTVSGSGTFGPAIKYTFSKRRTILAGTSIVKNITNIAANVIVRNQGSYDILSAGSSSGSVWINDVNSVLTLRGNNFLLGTGRILNATANGNIVNITYRTGSVPIATGYFHLNVDGAGTKTLASTTFVDGNLSIGSTAILTTNGFNLEVGGNFAISGNFIHTAGNTLTFNGTAPQALSYAQATTLTLRNVVLNNSTGLTVSSGIYLITESLTATAGVFNAGAQSVTLVSNANITARLGVTGATGGYSGSNFNIQRFLSARNANWADIASPIQNATVADLDDDLILSGVGGNDGNATYSNGDTFFSIYDYNEATATYNPLTSLGAPLTSGRGYEMWLAQTSTTMNDTTLDYIGTPTFGDQTIPVQRTGGPDPGWNLVGNPFASFITWDASIPKTNIDDVIFIFDNGTGDYATYGQGTVIPPGQGFYVYASAGSPSLTIPETAKSTSNASTFLRTAQDGLTLRIFSDLNQYTRKATLKLNDGTSSNAMFKKSPVKEAPSIVFAEAGKDLVIKTINGDESSLSIPVKVNAEIPGIYNIEASGVSTLGEYSCTTLEDKVTGKVINLNEVTNYSFEIKADSDVNRFVMHLSKSSSDCEAAAIATSTNEVLKANSQVYIINSQEGAFVQFANLEKSEKAIVSVQNVLGQTIAEGQTFAANNNDRVKINLPENLNGIYFITVQLSNQIISEKVVLTSIK